MSLPISRRKDPTQTKTLRDAWSREASRRMMALKGDVVRAVITDDVFGLTKQKAVFMADSPGWKAFAFRTDAQKHREFIDWMQEQMDKRLLDINWQTGYIDSAYKKGMLDAYIAARPELASEEIPGFEGMNQDQFIRQSFSAPIHRDTVELLYARSFEGLKGITAEMSKQMSPILAQGLVDGDGPRKIARALNNRIDKIGRTRAVVLARTETIRAHAEGALNSYESFGIYDVEVQAEWSTAGDDRVCDLCLPLEGVVMSISEARGLIPRHPLCRCTWIPARENKREKGQKRGDAAEKAIKISAEREAGTKKPTQTQLDRELNRIRRQRGEEPLPAGSADSVTRSLISGRILKND